MNIFHLLLQNTQKHKIYTPKQLNIVLRKKLKINQYSMLIEQPAVKNWYVYIPWTDFLGGATPSIKFQAPE